MDADPPAILILLGWVGVLAACAGGMWLAVRFEAFRAAIAGLWLLMWAALAVGVPLWAAFTAEATGVRVLAGLLAVLMLLPLGGYLYLRRQAQPLARPQADPEAFHYRRHV